jgi:hypothetical protein
MFFFPWVGRFCREGIPFRRCKQLWRRKDLGSWSCMGRRTLAVRKMIAGESALAG